MEWESPALLLLFLGLPAVRFIQYLLSDNPAEEQTDAEEENLLSRMQAAADSDGERSVIQLAEGVSAHSEAVRSLALKGLSQRLPYLSAAQFDALPLDTRANLYAGITLGNAFEYPVYVTTLLKHVNRLEDTGALKYVELLANAESSLPNTDGIILEAQACTKKLRESLAQRLASGILGRPALNDQADVLLKPAGNPQTETAALLRPSDNIDVNL
jgi:hypothetical protein